MKVISTLGSARKAGDRSEYLEGYAFAVAELLRPDLAWAVVDYLSTHPIRDDWDRGALDAAVLSACGEAGAQRMRFMRPRRLGRWPCAASSHEKTS